VAKPYHQKQRGLRAMLLSMALFDELTCGFLVIALPLLRDRLHLSYAEAGLLFTVGALASLLVEPVINVVSDLGSKRIPILVGTVMLAGAFILAGLAHSFLVELLAFVIWSPAVGISVGLSQAALIDGAPHSSEPILLRWTIMSGVGDLMAPLLVALIVSLGLGWTALCVIAAVVWMLATLFLAWQRFPAPARAESSDEPAVGNLLAGVREALGNRELLRWAGIVLISSMPDEVFLAFAAFYLHDHTRASEGAIGLVLAIGIASGLLALILMDRLSHRVAGIKLLPWLAVIALAGFIVFLSASTMPVATVGLILVEIGAAGWYPIAKAAAYSICPGRPGVVLAVLSLGIPVDIALPGCIGLLASHFGLVWAIGALALSPLGVLLLQPRRQNDR
jgi:FSR family fosmidomycin resistance protein-like MFS transporter